MKTQTLHEIAAEHIVAARESSAGRSTTMLTDKGATMKQLVVALAEGKSLADHANPGEATVLVVTGTVEVIAEGESVKLTTGDFTVITPERHSVQAHTDAAFILSVVSTPDRTEKHVSDE